MFENAGAKLKVVVQVIFWILFAVGIIVIIMGFVTMGTTSSYLGAGVGAQAGGTMVLSGILIIVLAYIQCLFYAAFAQLTDNVRRIEGSIQQIGGGTPTGAAPVRQGPPVCPNCGTQVKPGSQFCPNCGTKI